MINMTSGKYFNKGVKALDAPHIGHVVRETPNAVVVFGGKQERFTLEENHLLLVTTEVDADHNKIIRDILPMLT